MSMEELTLSPDAREEKDEEAKSSTAESKTLPFKRILVPLDGSEHSIKALKTAVQIVLKFGGRITLIHVYQVGGFAISPDASQRVY